MRALFALGLGLFMILTSMLVTPRLSYAKENVAVAVIEENLGKSAGVGMCGVAIVMFPPAALICGATIIAGAAADGDILEY